MGKRGEELKENRISVIFCVCLGPVLFFAGGCSSQKADTEKTVEPVVRDGDDDYRNAQNEFKKKEYKKAIELLESAAAKKMKLYTKSDVFQLLGLSYRHLYKYDQAIEFLNKSIEEDPQNHEAYVLRGVVFRVQKKYTEAAQSYNQALQLKPDNAELHTSLGALHIFQKDYAKAIEHLKLAVELDGSVPVTHSNLALAYANVGDFDQAKICLEKATVLGYKQPDVIQAKIDRLKIAAIENGPTQNSPDISDNSLNDKSARTPGDR